MVGLSKWVCVNFFFCTPFLANCGSVVLVCFRSQEHCHPRVLWHCWLGNMKDNLQCVRQLPQQTCRHRLTLLYETVIQNWVCVWVFQKNCTKFNGPQLECWVTESGGFYQTIQNLLDNTTSGKVCTMQLSIFCLHLIIELLRKHQH